MFSDLMNIMDALESSDKGFLSLDGSANMQTIQESGINPDGSHFVRTRIIISSNPSGGPSAAMRPKPGASLDHFGDDLMRQIEQAIEENNQPQLSSDDIQKPDEEPSDPFEEFNKKEDDEEGVDYSQETGEDGGLKVTRIEKKKEAKSKGARTLSDEARKGLEESLKNKAKKDKKINKGAKLIIILIIFTLLSLLGLKLIGKLNVKSPETNANLYSNTDGKSPEIKLDAKPENPKKNLTELELSKND